MSRVGHRAAWGIAATIAIVAVPAGALLLWQKAHPDALTIARRAYDRGDWKRVNEALRGIVSPETARSADLEAVRLYARWATRMRRDTVARALYESRLASADLEPEDVFLKGVMLTRTGRPEAGLELWEASLKRGVDHAEMLDHFARLSARYQRLDPALDAARRLARQPGWESRGLFLVGQLADLIDDPPGVVEALDEALRRDPAARGAVLDAAHYRRILARHLLRLGRPSDAERALEAIRPGSPGEDEDREAAWLLSRAFLQQVRMAEASAALTRSGSYRAQHRLTPEPAPYVGSSACVRCHREEARTYGGTRHTRTFHHGAGLLNLPRPDGPVPDPDDPRVTHRIVREGDRIRSFSEIDGRVARMVAEYAFGTPDHYLTMIARDDEGNARALRVSYYHTAAGSGWGATAGDVGHSGSVE
ncbi:MAG TPA: hypothetical protein VKW77_06680, partial [Acidimicrobiales bacterium]|nr:hypothetical protein [Acidimicrobiales bacterium]